MEKEYLESMSTIDLVEQLGSVEESLHRIDLKQEKIKEIIAAEQEIGIPTSYLEELLDKISHERCTLCSIQDELASEQKRRSEAETEKKPDRAVLPTIDEVAEDISHVEGEQRSLFVKALQEGNGERCAKMAEGCVLDYLGRLGCEQPLRSILAPYIRSAIRIGIAKYKYGGD